MAANVCWLVATNKPNEGDADDSDIEQRWTRALFDCAALGARSWSEAERQRLVYVILDQFADKAFIGAAAAFLVKSDLLHIERGDDDRAYLLSVREALWSRLKKTSHWQRHLWSSREGMEVHLKELIAAFFFKVSYGFGEETSYTKGIEGRPLLPFLPLLAEIASVAPNCPTIAHFFLDVAECVGGDAAGPYLLQAAERWVAEGDERFWGEFGVGRRVCTLGLQADLAATPEAWVDVGDRAAGAGVGRGREIEARYPYRTDEPDLIRTQSSGERFDLERG